MGGRMASKPLPRCPPRHGRRHRRVTLCFPMVTWGMWTHHPGLFFISAEGRGVDVKRVECVGCPVEWPLSPFYQPRDCLFPTRSVDLLWRRLTARFLWFFSQDALQVVKHGRNKTASTLTATTTSSFTGHVAFSGSVATYYPPMNCSHPFRGPFYGLVMRLEV